MKQIYLREKRNNEFNENALDYIFGAPVVPSSFENTPIDEYNMFFMQIDLNDKNIDNLPKGGTLYIFFDTKEFYHGALGEKAIQVKLYYSKEEPDLILDDYNDAFLDNLPEGKTQFEVEKCIKKEVRLQLGGTPWTVNEEKWAAMNEVSIVSIPEKSKVLSFFEHFVNGCKEAIITKDKDLKIVENTWLDGKLHITTK